MADISATAGNMSDTGGAAAAAIASSPSSSSSSYTFLIANASKPPSSQHADQSSTDKNDRFAHTRTKRKRTSPEDFVILEAEYQINTKPDKDTRAALADRVSLSEKEIQVWFQNRRQMTRRKRHTWQPNEITSIIRSAEDYSRDDSPRTESRTSALEDNSELIEDAKANQVDNERRDSKSSDITENQSTNGSQSTITFSGSQEDTQSSLDALVASQNAPASFLQAPMSSQDADIAASQAFTPRNLKRTSSMVRLAMSLDGKASVILRGETPSPPTKSIFSNPTGRNSLHRSQSLLASSSLSSSQDIPQSSLPSIPRLPGRSRDTRTWEFWCDSELRESLTKSADFEQRGSAAGPISLLRSGSSSLKPSGKANSAPKKRKSEEDLGEPRPKLSRTKSSYARLQSTDNAVKKVNPPKNGSTTIYVDGEDSDKENVDPNGITSATTPCRNNATPRVLGNKRQILQENNNVPSHATSLGALLAKEKTPGKTPGKTPVRRIRKTIATGDKENVAIDSEVNTFMKGGPGKVQVEDDLDAVQNLLRLSQGAWR